jgi:hypothetical protein
VGYAEYHLGNLAEAAVCCEHALTLHREAGDRFYEADTLNHLGDIWHAATEPSQATRAWLEALAIFDSLEDPNADLVRVKLAGINDQSCPSPSP